MHVGVFADIEGSFGIWRMRQCRMGTREWQYGRACLTEDINHVVQGAFEGGADRVTVKDTHESGFNCLINKLDPRVQYRGGHFTKPSFYGDISDLNLVLYVAIHAAAGTDGAFFPHTHYGIFSEVLLNDKPACEMYIYGAYLGEYGIPVGFVSGEDIAIQQAMQVLPWAKSVMVDKKKEAYTSGNRSLRYLKEGREALRRIASESVRNVSLMKPLKLSGPIYFEAVFRDEQLADRYNTWHFTQNGSKVQWDANNVMDGFDMLNKLTFFPKRIYPFRRTLAFFMRRYFYIKNTYFAPKPNPEDAVIPL
jgi:D-amino peptidase